VPPGAAWLASFGGGGEAEAVSDSWPFLVVGSVLTLVATSATTWVQGLVSRGGHREDRVWSKRAELYVDLLAATARGTDGRARAFASDEVLRLWTELVEKQDALNSFVSRTQTSGFDEAWTTELNAHIHETRQVSTRMEQQIRYELRIDKAVRKSLLKGPM